MVDTFTPEKRSAIMRAVKGKDTSPELAIRRLVHSLGYRYRLHRANLPGKPDLVFPGRKKIIFVHGCFWHWHGCKRSRMPEANRNYWKQKIGRNVKRDRKTRRDLKSLGWKSMVIWECQSKAIDAVSRKIKRFLDDE